MLNTPCLGRKFGVSCRKPTPSVNLWYKYSMPRDWLGVKRNFHVPSSAAQTAIKNPRKYKHPRIFRKSKLPPVKRVVKNIKFPGQQPVCCWPLFIQWGKVRVFPSVLVYPDCVALFCVVIANASHSYLHELLTTGKVPAIIAFPFQNVLEVLCVAIVNVASHPRCGLCHSGLYKFLVKCSVCVLEISSTLNQRMNLRVGFSSLVKSLGCKSSVVTLILAHRE